MKLKVWNSQYSYKFRNELLEKMKLKTIAILKFKVKKIVEGEMGIFLFNTLR